MLNEVARNIYNELEVYAHDHHSYPTQGALYAYMAKPQWNNATLVQNEARYPELKVGMFNHWFDRLVSEGYIEVDRSTRAIRCTNLVISEKEISEQ